MLQLHRILHPTDFSAGARAALGHALRLARRHGAVLHVLHVAPDLSAYPLAAALGEAGGVDTLYHHLRQEADAQMTSMLADAGADVERVYAYGAAPAPVILDYAAQVSADLIVMGTHGRRGFREMLLGSVAQEVVRRAQCPVLTVREPGDAPAAAVPVVRVLAPVDFSASSREALRYAKLLADFYDADLDLLHVVGAPHDPEHPDRPVPDVDEEQLSVAEASMQALARLAAETPGPDVETSTHVRLGYPAREVLTFAENHRAGLIVMATHGLTCLQHFFFGSVTEKVVQRAPCPVFVVKSFGKSLLPPRPDAAAEAAR